MSNPVFDPLLPLLGKTWRGEFLPTLHLKNGSWVPGRETFYSEAPQAEVRFKT